MYKFYIYSNNTKKAENSLENINYVDHGHGFVTTYKFIDQIM